MITVTEGERFRIAVHLSEPADGAPLEPAPSAASGLLSPGVLAGAFGLAALVSLAAGIVFLTVVLILAAVFVPLLSWSIGMMDGAWVEVDRPGGVVRAHKPGLWDEPREELLSAFCAVELFPAHGEVDDFWTLGLTRRDSLFALEICGTSDPATITPVVQGLAKATGLPLGEEARRVLGRLPA